MRYEMSSRMPLLHVPEARARRAGHEELLGLEAWPRKIRMLCTSWEMPCHHGRPAHTRRRRPLASEGGPQPALEVWQLHRTNTHSEMSWAMPWVLPHRPRITEA
eukprot:g1343.t1